MRNAFGTGSPSSAKTAAAKATPAEEAAPKWQKTAAALMERFIGSGYVTGITKSGIQRLEQRIMGEMEKYIRENPNKSADQLDEMSKKITLRNLSMARVDGQREAKLKSRIQELQQDRWG